ncbi:hypothetical protein BCT47_21680 [Vibrio splendidus]|uniref:Uncharacterized protein n=1 Tax=Vibrio splendidus TaxID=29497 RepID=A0AB35N1Q2_VIBSP|nr:hypothetical protein [Vibrio splendidus]MDP2502900.1 hypothetical protein [Vibrio splendidus]PMM74404.1 hypothetical protein BCT47_21680 [Vibrio splendidus]PTO81217.1 hypothetical protein CWN93_14855 [Vibrio splendidus]
MHATSERITDQTADVIDQYKALKQEAFYVQSESNRGIILQGLDAEIKLTEDFYTATLKALAAHQSGSQGEYDVVIKWSECMSKALDNIELYKKHLGRLT